MPIRSMVRPFDCEKHSMVPRFADRNKPAVENNDSGRWLTPDQSHCLTERFDSKEAAAGFGDIQVSRVGHGQSHRARNCAGAIEPVLMG